MLKVVIVMNGRDKTENAETSLLTFRRIKKQSRKERAYFLL